jgi:hypothetical protein
MGLKLLHRGLLEWHYLRTKFHEILPSSSKVISGGQTGRQTGDVISLHSFLGSRLIKNYLFKISCKQWDESETKLVYVTFVKVEISIHIFRQMFKIFFVLYAMGTWCLNDHTLHNINSRSVINFVAMYTTVSKETNMNFIFVWSSPFHELKLNIWTEYKSLLGYSAVQSRWIRPTFEIFVLPPSSGRIIKWMMDAVLTLKHRSTSTRLHGAISQKAVTFILAAVRTRNLKILQFLKNGSQYMMKYITGLHVIGIRSADLRYIKAIFIWFMLTFTRWGAQSVYS